MLASLEKLSRLDADGVKKKEEQETSLPPMIGGNAFVQKLAKYDAEQAPSEAPSEAEAPEGTLPPPSVEAPSEGPLPYPSTSLPLKDMVKALDARQKLSPVKNPFGYSDPQYAKAHQMKQQGPGIYAAPERTPLQKALNIVGGRLLSEPVDVVKELIFSPDRTQVLQEIGKDVLEWPTLGASRAIDALLDLKSTEDEKKEAVALAGLGLGLTRPGRATLKYAFKGTKGALDLATKPFSYLDDKLKTVTDYVWQNLLVRPANARIIPTFERVPGSEGMYEKVKKSLADIMQPAIERMPKNLQSTFRTTQVMKAHTTRIGQEMGQLLTKATPSVRYEVIKGLRGTPIDELRTSEAKEILGHFDQSIRDVRLKTPYEIEFKDRLGKLLTAKVKAPEQMFVGDDTYRFLNTLESSNLFQDKAFMSKTRRVLIDAIENPNVSDNFKVMARELYNLPASLPEEVAKASKDASTAYLASKLKGYSGVARASIPKGAREGDYLKSTWGPMKKGGQPLYVQRDVELELRALDSIPKIARGITNRYFMTPWKTMKVMDRPASHIRNTFGNVMLNHIGGLPFWHMDTYLEAAQGMRKGASTWKDFSRITGAGGTFSVNEVNEITSGLKYGSTALDYGLSLFDRIHRPVKTLYNAEEQLFKYAKYLHNLKQGMSKPEAAWDAVKWTFNYGEITRATARMRTHVAPFFTWQSKIIPLMAEAAVKHPVQLTTMITLYQMMQNNAISSVGISDDEWTEVERILPEYIKDGMFLMMPWRDEQGRLNMANMTYWIPGFGDVTDIKARPMTFFLSNPVYTMTGTLLSKTKYSGAPLYYSWEPPETKFAKATSYIWEQLMPAVMPGGTDWNMMWDMFNDVPEGLSGPQALSSLLGFKITPVNLEIAQRKAKAIERIHLSEMAIEMKRELRRATSDEDREAIVAKYADLRPEVLGVEEE